MTDKTQMVMVDVGPAQAPVPKGGYYDRFRMNPDLDQVAQDPAAGNIDFFRRIPKYQSQSRIGRIWAPNFYYRSSNAQLMLLAPIAKLRRALPEPLQPLRVFPGYGIVALTFFDYHLCDNDPYREVSVAVVVRRPGARGAHLTELLSSMKRRSFFAHVLALPVDTEIARLRGVQGYQLPKWLAQIDMRIDKDIRAAIKALDGAPDLILSAPLPEWQEAASQSHLATSTLLNRIDGVWHQTVVQSNMLSFAQRILPKDVVLQRGDGPLSQLLTGLGAERILRFDAVRDAQLVLNLPTKSAVARDL